jgi:hypothetical protein
MRERVDLKSPVLENGPPGSVRGASGNRRPYLDMANDPQATPDRLNGVTESKRLANHCAFCVNQSSPAGGGADRIDRIDRIGVDLLLNVERRR